jgi:hypothetical protein
MTGEGAHGVLGIECPPMLTQKGRCDPEFRSVDAEDAEKGKKGRKGNHDLAKSRIFSRLMGDV